MEVFNKKHFMLVLTGLSIIILAVSFMATGDDTDIYRPKVRHNVIVLLDTSDSMGFGVYDNNIDYHAFYQYICENPSTGFWTQTMDDCAGYCTASYNTSAHFYNYSFDRDRIYLVRGDIGFQNGMTGDAADPDYLWYGSSMIDTGTDISSDGTLSGGNLRVGTDNKIEYYYGGAWATLPNGQDIEIHDWQENPDGSLVDKGFAGLVRAPGYYFSGYFSSNSTGTMTNDPAAAYQLNGRSVDYFFITGNWMNMQTVYNLSVYDHPNWLRAWEVCTYPAQYYQPVVDFQMTSANYPSNYTANYDSQQDGTVNYVIYNGEASQIRIHFEALTLAAGDKIEMYDQNGNKVGSDITTMPTDGWTSWVTGNKILLRFVTDNDAATVASGWKVNAYQYQSTTDYDFFSRLEIASAAMIDVVESTRGRVNWGVMLFERQGGVSKAEPPLNPSFNDDQQRQSIINALTNNVTASGDSHLGEAMQDVFEEFHGKVNQIHKSCNKNFVIVLTDGYPDEDDDWTRITGVDFTDSAYHDCDPTPDPDGDATTCLYQYTQDPFQYASPNPDYYDDVAYYMYTHSYVDYTLIAEEDREDSADNIIVHNIGFSRDMPILEHASEVAGGLHLTAFSKSQLVNAFHSLGLLIAEYTSYTAPVVSVDEANRVQSGDKLYMALFKPNEDLQWTGNMKKYGLAYGTMVGCDRGVEWYTVDKTGKTATECDGDMIEETASYWSTQNDGGDVERGGAGQVLYNSIPTTIGTLTASAVTTADFRNIHTCLSGSTTLTRVATDTIANTDLSVSTDEDRYMIINHIYGYTYEAHDATTAAATGGVAAVGSPVAKRSWPLGPIIHSTPKIIDYLNTDGTLDKRYIAVGSNDGMLHVFNDDDGSELFAFVPTEALPLLQGFDPDSGSTKTYTVDGSAMLVTDSSGNRLLVFGLRRGGKAYYALNVTDTDPANWTLQWKIDNTTTGMEELGYSFATPEAARIKTGTGTYRTILVIPGGYDLAEDKSTPEDDYDLTDTHTSTVGRGIFLIDVDTGLPLSSTYFSTDVSLPSGYTQFVRPHLGDLDSSGTDDGDEWMAANTTTLMAQMRYCFPADPRVVLDDNGYLLAAYVADLYGQIWKLRYTYEDDSGTVVKKFHLNLIFKTNPITDQNSAYENRTAFSTWVSGGTDPRGTISYVLDNQDYVNNPRKTFFSPDISWAGNCYTDIPVLYMGTGDREHPTFIGSSTGGYSPVQNGLYAFYDAQAYHEIVLGGTYTDPSSLDPTVADFYNDCFSEKDLLNFTCGVLDAADVTEDTKSRIITFMQEETVGWYQLFSDLSGCAASDDDGSHDGEKAISPVSIFAKVVYTPTFQPINPSNANDPCVYDGKARIYAVDYCTGNAAFNYNTDNDTITTDMYGNTTTEEGTSRRDRYKEVGDHIPSGVSIIIREGEPAAFISVGGKIVSLEDIDMPAGMIPYYWREIFQ